MGSADVFAGSCLQIVPTLQGFVMNRIQGDYLENLLYKIFVSLDERTNMEGVSDTIFGTFVMQYCRCDHLCLNACTVMYSDIICTSVHVYYVVLCCCVMFCIVL